MNIHVSRRSFLTSTAAAAGGLALGFHVPFPTEAAAQTPTTPEINAWVVIKPDDTVVVRIARVEMGQGTLTGLAQLVAEELECDWAKVTTEYPTPGQNVARNRVWGNFSTGGSRGVRDSHDYVRKGGAAARMMLVQAAANEWKVEPASCTVSKGVITHTASGRTTTYGKVAEAASKLEAPKDITLKDPKSWTIAGKPLKRLDTPDKLNGKTVYAIDVKLPGMLNAALKVCPVFGGKVKSFDFAKIEKMPGVKKALPIGETGVAVVADTWWRAKTALEALPIEWDLGPNAPRAECGHRGSAERRPDRRTDVRRQPERRRQGGARRRCAHRRGRVRLPAPASRHHGADERHGALDREQVRGLDLDAECGSRTCDHRAGLRPADREVRGVSPPSRRRFRPTRARRFRPLCGVRGQADAGRADQDDLVTRRGHDARHLSSEHAVQAGRRPRRERQPHRPAHAHLGAVDPGSRSIQTRCRTDATRRHSRA